MELHKHRELTKITLLFQELLMMTLISTLEVAFTFRGVVELHYVVNFGILEQIVLKIIAR